MCAVLQWRTVHMQGARVHRFAALLCDVMQFLSRSLSLHVYVCVWLELWCLLALGVVLCGRASNARL